MLAEFHSAKKSDWSTHFVSVRNLMYCTLWNLQPVVQNQTSWEWKPTDSYYHGNPWRKWRSYIPRCHISSCRPLERVSGRFPMCPKGRPGRSKIPSCLESHGCHLIPFSYLLLVFCLVLLLFLSCYVLANGPFSWTIRRVWNMHMFMTVFFFLSLQTMRRALKYAYAYDRVLIVA